MILERISMNKMKIKYYVVTLEKCDRTYFMNTIKTKNLFTSSAYEFGKLEYNRRVKTIDSEKEAVYFIADFGTSKEKFFKPTCINVSDKYFPYLVIETSDPVYYNMIGFDMQKAKIILETTGIEQTFFNTNNAFQKFQKYLNNRVLCTIYMKYLDPKTGTFEKVKLTSTVDVLLGDLQYMKRFKLVK